MLTEKGQAKIMDFGLAKLEGKADLTETSTVMGTTAYMSPERARGDPIDQRTDIWSFGARSGSESSWRGSKRNGMSFRFEKL